MKSNFQKELSPAPKPRGFALVVTLMLMVRLSILALGMLSLSTVALRSGSASFPKQIAQANAGMALMLAIGDLQKNAGPDTRITARADILDEANPHVLGVWKSWEGSDHETTGSAAGRPVSPGNYKTAKQSRFLSWLVSGDQTVIPNTDAGTSKVTLVGKGSVGEGADPKDPAKSLDDLQIRLKPVDVSEGDATKGTYAWWVCGENMKARVPSPSEPSSGTAEQWASVMKSYGKADPKPFGLDILLADPGKADKAISNQQIDLITMATPRISREFFHDLSASSVGLQTNSATGGWKKDLSLFTENSNLNSGSIPDSGLPLFRIKPDKDSVTTLATTGSVRGSKSVLYPWADYRGTASDIPIYQHAAVASWNNLIDYTLLDKKVDSGANSIPSHSVDIVGNKYDFLHKVRIIPVIARIQWVYSYGAGAVTGAPVPAPPAGSLEPRLILTPVITMWNPYNLALSTGILNFNIPRPLPSALRFKAGGIQGQKYFSLLAGSNNYPNTLSGGNSLAYRLNEGLSLLPGETRIFSPTSTVPTAHSNGAVDLTADYRPGGGHYFNLKDDQRKTLYLPPTATVKADAKFDVSYNDGRPGGGIYLDMGVGGGRHLVYRIVYTPAVAAAVYQPATDLAESNALSNLQNNPSPFLTTIFGFRMASRTHIPAKGFIQSSPLVNYTAMGGKDEAERTIGRHYRGTAHPVNSPFDYSFQKLTANDSHPPQANAATRRGFIVTGFQKSDGLSRCVIAELPTRPLQSLGELQNWDLRYENPIPPFAFNLIGNSSATPLIGAGSVITDYDSPANLQHDDSYCANHVLFDDWFFSSIAPDPANFGSSGKDLKTVFTAFINGTAKLPNSACRPITRDAGGNANDLFTKHVNTADSWKIIASRLEVEGMFNVNSTSETAWRAILGHARGRKVPYLGSSGGGMSVKLSGKTDYATSRFSVAGDTDTDSIGTSGTFENANQFTGYRVFDEAMIDALAKETVKQVHLRGPFLSLSEFVNRQLSSGDPERLEYAGALQSALEQISKSPATSPYSEISSTLPRKKATANPPGDGEEYAFGAAAVGESVFGLPGWTRQADILRPLAPILTVRDDTFTIRAYGDARDKNNNITAKAVCEATVRRTRDYVDPADAADLATYPTSAANRTFGRRFTVISFRWVSPNEI
jgi:hypothetical protein